MERDHISRKTLKDGTVKEYKYKRIIKGTKKTISPRQQLRNVTSDLSQELCTKILKFIEEEKKKPDEEQLDENKDKLNE